MRTLAALAFIFSAQAYACPQLAGAYTCKYQDNSTEVVTIAQDLKDGVTVYVYNGSNIAADNKATPVPDDANIKNGTLRAWCDDDVTLKAELLGKYWNNGSYFGDLTMNMAFAKAGNDLKQTSTGNVKNTGGTYPINSDLTCTKN